MDVGITDIVSVVSLCVSCILCAIMTYHSWSEISKFFRLMSSKPRDAGHPMGCDDTEDKDGALCYPKCRTGYEGVGPVCWQHPCPDGTRDIGAVCTKESYGRTAGKPLHSCPSDHEKDGLLCYPKCRAGFTGVGPMCWGQCPEGFSSGPTFCGKPPSYGRGAGYPWKFGDPLNDSKMFERCTRDNPQGCEKSGAVVYPKCKPGYHAVGCCICSPDCPSGFHDTGATCERPRYGRTAGSPMGCADDEDKDGALCYPKCKEGNIGIGPVCYTKCPSTWKDTGTQCQKHSYGRTAGKPLHVCPPGKVKDGLLCYDPCPSDYPKGVGPVCWKK